MGKRVPVGGYGVQILGYVPRGRVDYPQKGIVDGVPRSVSEHITRIGCLNRRNRLINDKSESFRVNVLTVGVHTSHSETHPPALCLSDSGGRAVKQSCVLSSRVSREVVDRSVEVFEGELSVVTR